MTIQSRAEFMAERNRHICELAKTKTAREIAIECKVNLPTVHQILRGHGIVAVKASHPRLQDERNRNWIEAYESGAQNASEIAADEGLSRERVCQILRPHRVIEKRLERQRIVKEALSEEAERLKREAKEAQAMKLAPAIEMVRQGQSVRSAAISIGLHQPQEQRLLASACKAQGVTFTKGRWRDFSERKRRIEELFAAGLSVARIVKTLRADGDPNVYYQWIASNMPHLKLQRQTAVRGQIVSLRPVKPIKADPDEIWSNDKIQVLRKGWCDGLSAAHIADLLGPGFTRNSVIGKANRLRTTGQLFVIDGAVQSSVASSG